MGENFHPLIYPYSKAYEPYVRNEGILGEYLISALVSPRGWGYEGDVVADRQGREHMVSADFSEQWQGWDRIQTNWLSSLY